MHRVYTVCTESIYCILLCYQILVIMAQKYSLLQRTGGDELAAAVPWRALRYCPMPVLAADEEEDFLGLMHL